MSTRTEREEWSKQLKLLYTDKNANRDKLIALQAQLSALKSAAKISMIEIGIATVETLIEDVSSLVRREFELTDKAVELEKKMLEQ